MNSIKKETNFYEEKRLSVIDQVLEDFSLGNFTLPDNIPTLYYPSVSELEHSLKGKEDKFYPIILYFSTNPYKNKVDTQSYKELVAYCFKKANELYNKILNSNVTQW